MNPEFWRGKRVFLTGHTGFKGSWTSLWLAHLGAEVRGYALDPPTTPSLFKLAAVSDCVQSVVGDMRDHSTLVSSLVEFRPDVVLHLAAQSVVLQSYRDPIETYSTNVMGTANLLDGLRRLSDNCVMVNVTTDKVYENRGPVAGYREDDRLGGRDPYSSSKACAELLARAFRDSYFAVPSGNPPHISIASARAGNVIGGGDWTPWQLVPDTIRAIAEDRKVVLRHPDAIRPWQHVLDCLSGYLTLAEALCIDGERFSGEWNFGPADNELKPVSAIVDTLAKHWGIEDAWVRDAQLHPHEESQLLLDSRKAGRELGWRSQLSLADALEWTANWYKDCAGGKDARVVCMEQVDQYMAMGARAGMH